MKEIRVIQVGKRDLVEMGMMQATEQDLGNTQKKRTFNILREIRDVHSSKAGCFDSGTIKEQEKKSLEKLKNRRTFK